MRADRGIDAAACGVVRQHDVVQTLAHAVQTLKFKGGTVGPHVQNGGDGMGIMGGELRIDPVRHVQQFARMGDIADISSLFAGKDGKGRQAQNLRALHLGVPIGALDQPHHDLAVQFHRQPIQPVDHRPGAAAISLHHHPESVPTFQAFVGQHRLDHIQRQGQTVGLFGVDVETQTGGARQPCQRAHARHQFHHHPVTFGDLIARMQRREFHRYSGIAADIAVGGGASDRGDRFGIRQMITPRVGFGARRLAQHVIGIGIALGLQILRAFHRQINGFAQHEVAAHLLHGAAHGGADHRFAQTLDRRAQMPHHPRFALVQHLPGQHQGPG